MKHLISFIVLIHLGNISISQTLEGKYIHYISKVMGGYKISQSTELEIELDENKSITYFITTIVTDEYNGGQPKTQYTSGKIKKLTPLKYKFYDGSYGERGAYISFLNTPKDPVSEFRISFAPGRGDPMNFIRKE